MVDVEAFCRDGFTRLEGAVGEEAIAQACRGVWNELGPVGILEHDQRTWTAPVVRVRCLDEAILEVERTPPLTDAYDALIGPQRWLPPGNAGDVIPVRFPSEQPPPDAGWHVEGNWMGTTEYHTDVWSTGRGLFVLVLLTDTGLDDAPMGIVPGSHLDVPGVLSPMGAGGLGGAAIVAALDPAIMCRRAAFATGEAGDAYLCHPFLVHTATWPHRGDGPRIALVAKVETVGPFAIDGSDDSPVARTIAAGVART